MSGNLIWSRQPVCAESVAYRIVIPARLNASRLPGKALLDLGGKPMIVRVLERARQSAAVSVHVATDDEGIAEVVRSAGGEVVMTDMAHRSGTDRLAEAVQGLAWADDELVVNLQGDEPAMPAACLDQVAGVLASDEAAAMATLWTPIDEAAQRHDPNVVKLVAAHDGRVLLFSRACIPHWRQGTAANELLTEPQWRRHLGLYAYRVSALKAWPQLPPSPLEQAESLEQLRALQAGWVIVSARAVAPVPAGVDSPEDLARMRLLYPE